MLAEDGVHCFSFYVYAFAAVDDGILGSLILLSLVMTDVLRFAIEDWDFCSLILLPFCYYQV